ncbi:hypothetical protein BDF14DRAFT_1885495 [Spinellus fusiger]|nr:hypothetical protein BDF14DRAFT_1885495 [Spinellus fusiger]
MTRLFDSNSQESQRPLLSNAPPKKSYRRTRLLTSLAVVSVFGLTCIYLSRELPSAAYEQIQTKSIWKDPTAATHVVAPGISFNAFRSGLGKCQSIVRERTKREEKHHHQEETVERLRNPRTAQEPNTQLLIRNGTLWLRDHYLLGDILVEGGLIRRVEQRIEAPRNARVIDAKGRVVTPGIVDMHSHMMVSSFPGLTSEDDTNEASHPTTPYLRVIDAMNPSDPGIKIVASGGVTTSLILPGSANVMGGEAAVVKLRPVDTLSNHDMLITAGTEERDQEVEWRYMKMACGENPKNVYGGQGMPQTRLGENYLLRKRFQEAQTLKYAQDDWCDAALRINSTLAEAKGSDTIPRLSERFPEALELESLVALLRHEVLLNVHCYLPHDIEALISHSVEFGFEIAALHHALSAWQIPDIIKRASTNITIATFSDMWGYKAEAWSQNVNAPTILANAGIPVAFKSDHPVLNARDLLFEAQKAYHYGFDEHLSLAAITNVPAKALALDHRIGSLDVGKDADIVIWERHPLRLGARPRTVIVDGVELDFKASWTKNPDMMAIKEEFLEPATAVTEEKKKNETVDSPSYLPSFPTATMTLEDHGLGNTIDMKEACGPRVNSFVMRNISQIYMGPQSTYSSANGSAPAYLVVKNGTITCIGSECSREYIDWPVSSPVFEMGGGVIIPGIVSSGISLGLVEIQSEDSTMDGVASHDTSSSDLAHTVVRAIDGLKFNGLHLQRALKSGSTTSISSPLSGSDLLSGVSAAFKTGVENTVLDSNDAIVSEEAALHFVIGYKGKTTVSQQIATIRDLLISNVEKDPLTNVFARAAQGKLPVVIQTDNRDEIASILQMKQQLYLRSNKQYSVQFIIYGGAEAYLVASHLKRMDIPVILMSARCMPGKWSSRLCMMGPPLTPLTGLDVLLRHKVKVGLTSTDPENGDAGGLIWEAGWNLAHNDQLTPSDAIGLITWNIASMFGMPKETSTLKVGQKAEFVAYNGNPLEFGARVMMVYGGGHAGPLCSL